MVSGDDPYGDLRPRHCATKIRDDGRVRVACQPPGERPAPARWRWVLRANFGKTAPGNVPYCEKCAAALLGGETASL